MEGRTYQGRVSKMAIPKPMKRPDTTAAKRQERMKLALVRDGGKRTSISLPRDAVLAISGIMARDSITANQAIISAILGRTR